MTDDFAQSAPQPFVKRFAPGTYVRRETIRVEFANGRIFDLRSHGRKQHKEQLAKIKACAKANKALAVNGDGGELLAIGLVVKFEVL